jgi:hypothetical protein
VLAQHSLQLDPREHAIDNRHRPDRIASQRTAAEGGGVAADVCRVVVRALTHHDRSPGLAGARVSPHAECYTRDLASQMYRRPGVLKRAASQRVLTYDEDRRRKSSGARLTSMAQHVSFFHAAQRTLDAGDSADRSAKIPPPPNEALTRYNEKNHSTNFMPVGNR